MLLRPCTPVAAAPADLEVIGVTNNSSPTEVAIRLSRPASYQVRTLAPDGEHPYRVYVDLNDTKLAPGMSRQRPLTGGPVTQIRVGQFTPTQARVVLDLSEPASYAVEAEHEPFRILLRVWKPSGRGSDEPRFVDNGNGTIADGHTGLMWEKKDNAGSMHDVDNVYAWTGSCTEPPYDFCQPSAEAAAACTAQTGGAYGCKECSSGTCELLEGAGTVWEWLVQLNAEGGTGFAGYGDWRLPEVNRDGGAMELDSLVDLSQVSAPHTFDEFKTACTPACVATDSHCSCTAAADHWSATTGASSRGFAWGVHFRYRDVYVYDSVQLNGHHVRAVRGGL